MADNDDDLVDYDEEEVREGNRSFIGRVECLSVPDRILESLVGSWRRKLRTVVRNTLRCNDTSERSHVDLHCITLHCIAFQSIRPLLPCFLP